MKQYRFVIFTLVFLLIGALMLGAAGCKKTEITPPIEEVPTDSCLSAGEQIDKDICYKTRSANEDITDYTFCNVINDWVLKDDCYENVFRRVASTIDCEGIEERAASDICWGAVAIKTGPYSCGKIISLTKRDNCYLEVSKNLKYPEDMEIEFCNRILDVGIRNQCLEIIKKPLGERS